MFRRYTTVSNVAGCDAVLSAAAAWDGHVWLAARLTASRAFLLSAQESASVCRRCGAQYMVKCTCICLIVHICVHLRRVINSSETCVGGKTFASTSCRFSQQHKQTGFDGTPQTSSSVRVFFVCLFDLSCSVFYFPWPMRAMRHHWLLLGACGWVLLILMFVSKFITFRAVDGKTSPCRVPSELPEDSRTPLTSLCLYRLR